MGFIKFIKTKIILRQLKKAKINKKYQPFSLAGLEKWAEVVDVYDGDTMKVIMKYRGGIDRWVVRLNGYDSPEMKPLLSDPNRNEIIEKAIIAKNALINKIGDKPVLLKITNFDKYGRLLADVFVDNENINLWMISNGYGYPYNGGKKLSSKEILQTGSS
jgi:endonuclease YncB( thermonuclease family)